MCKRNEQAQACSATITAIGYTSAADTVAKTVGYNKIFVA